MTSTPFLEAPFQGLLGLRKATIFKLDQSGTKPIAPIGALISRADPDRISLDVVDSESIDRQYSVTTNPLQDFTAATSNVSRELVRVTLSGLLVSSVDLPVAGSVGFPGLRTDLGRVEQIERLADERRPVMLITPRFSLPRAFVESISRTWGPGDGESIPVTISFVEARIVSPLAADQVVQDTGASSTGNNREQNQGAQAAPTIDDIFAEPSDTPGVAPTVIPA